MQLDGVIRLDQSGDFCGSLAAAEAVDERTLNRNRGKSEEICS